jgi:ABC-type multidrug transport system ATPase subunit
MSADGDHVPLSCEHLAVRYGRTQVLEDVSFVVPAGSVYALLGRNGAGKSSLVRCLVGQQHPTAGRGLLFGRDAWHDRAALMERVGLVPEEPDAPPDLPPSRLLDLVARLHGRWDGEGARARLRRFAIPMDTPFGRLSKGQKGAVMVALALGHAPDLLVLDDPTLGLDVVARDAVFDELIGELADHGHTVLVTTHDLAAIEGIADRVGILRDGRLVLDEPMEAVKERFARPLERIFSEVTSMETGGPR